MIFGLQKNIRRLTFVDLWIDPYGEKSMKDAPFIGREAEMKRLRGLVNKKSASLIVVRGRRRIGKSRLLAEFGKGMENLFFSGIPPVRGITAQFQRELFADQLSRD
jgi:hypothetical protein